MKAAPRLSKRLTPAAEPAQQQQCGLAEMVAIGIIVSNLCEEFGLPCNGRIYTDEELGGDDPEWNPPPEDEDPPPAAQRPSPTRPSQEYPTRDPNRYPPELHPNRDIGPCPD